MSPSGLTRPHSEADRDMSFDSNPEPNPQNLHRGEANGPPEPNERLGHLPGGGLRALPTPSANDGSGFHTNTPISELIERDIRAIKASAVSSAPLIAETEDGVTHENRADPY